MRFRTLKHTTVFILFAAFSCKKDTSTNTNTALPVKSKMEILTAKPWLVQEAYDLQGNSLNRYTRGGSGNTTNLDNDELTFKDNNSGSYKDATGQLYNLTWSFTNLDSSKMRVTIQYPTPVLLNNDMVRLSENGFTATHNYTNGSGNRVLASFHRIHK
jgi:hypothetical protein